VKKRSSTISVPEATLELVATDKDSGGITSKIGKVLHGNPQLAK
jgi:hypothetical protein